jgi:hypothetical protein
MAKKVIQPTTIFAIQHLNNNAIVTAGIRAATSPDIECRSSRAGT